MSTDTCWIETVSGKRFHVLNPTPEDVDIEDIAHALSMQCRFTGHTKKFYSVAEHSYHVSLLSKHDALCGLLHDASEAYISDLSRPVKYFSSIGVEYKIVEERLMKVILGKFGLSWPMPETVHHADEIMLWSEKEQLMGELSWGGVYGEQPDTVRYKLAGYNPEEARSIFLDRFEELISVPKQTVVLHANDL